MMSTCSGTILSIFCDLRGIQRRYCRLYLGIKIYRQSIRIIVGAHVAHNLLQNTLTLLHAPVSHLLNLNSSFLYPYKDSQTKPCRWANSYLAVRAQQNEPHHFGDYPLQAIPKIQESYPKDTTDFLNFVQKTRVAKGTMLVSMDVTNLYNNIPQEEGIKM